jgi:cyclopropane fatty-acyl-phospholipid synthase-like methyltransferase
MRHVGTVIRSVSILAPRWKALDLAEVGPSDLLVDAGCGDGQVCIAAARRLLACRDA